MDLLHFIRLARRNWPLVILSLVLSVGAALVVTAKTPPKYVATITMMVSGYDKVGSLTTAYQAGMLSTQRVQSYANLLTSRRVISQIAGGEDVRRLQAGVKAEAIPATMLLRAMVTDGNPARAARLANALGDRFARLIDQIERPTPKSSPTVKITVVDPADVPRTPVSPRPLVNIALAVLIALLLAFGSLVVRDRLDTTVKTSEVLQQMSRSSVLGVITYERDARRFPLIVRENGRSTRSEAYRSLRTNLQFIGVDRQPKSLVVTSCLPGEGKSSTSANLAITLAQAGWRVILVDGDLRSPRIPDYLGIEGSVGLTDVLIDKARLQDVIQTWGEPSLSVLPGGQIPPNPSELLGSRGMRAVLSQLVDDHDIVIVDAPPLLPITDAAALAAICDGTLLVARYGKTRREHLVRAVETLSSINARLVGAVLNFAPGKRAAYYGYGYGYRARAEVKTPVNV
ncbi:polysaccharide biosynthesis tyrosine autokinase [Sphaerisporangium sp. NPDC049002]|uniref:polysaccharide biosynthesis tyrosine autokinase n=1 Tax=unclassified Sphaerisporangium TaxID=2630420 RepID=UPI0033CA5ACC